MERALNLPDLVEVLGVHQPGVLPSPQELASLIADVEIRAFRGDFAVDENLERAAWYLHAVASASEAAELYTPVRQRRAFAVSAHVFDLTLADPRHDARQRLNLAFGAQVGYRRADLDPNATAVYLRVSELLIDNTPLVDHANTLAVEAGVAFLGLDTRFLFPLLRSWRRQLTELAATVELDDLQSTMFGPAQQIVRAVWSLLCFLAFGASRQLPVARAALRSAQKYCSRLIGEGPAVSMHYSTLSRSGKPQCGVLASRPSGQHALLCHRWHSCDYVPPKRGLLQN